MAALALSLMLAVWPPQLAHAAGFPVRCGPIGQDAAGEADMEHRVIRLTWDACRGLDQRRDHNWLVDSLVTLGHERAHLLGVTDERAADCKGFRDAPWLARRLHIRLRAVWLRGYARLSGLSC